MKESSLKKRYAIKLSASVISGVVGMVIVAIVPKAIGPVAYGQFVYLQQFFLKVIGFLDSGSSIAFFTKLSAKPERKELIPFYSIYALLVLLVVSSIMFALDYFGYSSYLLPEVDNNYIYWGVGFGFLTWVAQLCIKISDAYALTVSVELIKIVHKILSLCLLLYFINYLNFDLIKYFYFHLIVLVIFVGILLSLFAKSDILTINTLNISGTKLKTLFMEFISYCSPLFVYSAAGLLVGLFDIWLLQTVGGAIQTGFYGVAYSLAGLCFIFTGAMTPIITREFSKSFEEKNLLAMQELFKNYIPMLYSIAAYFAIFISFQSDIILASFTDDNFADAYWILVVIALYPIHQTYGQLSGSIFYATDQTKLYRNIGLISMFMGLVLTIFFIYILELNALGLAIKMIITQLISVNIQLYFNVRLLKLNIRSFIWHQIYSMVFFVTIATLSKLLVTLSSPLANFLVSGAIYTFLTLLGLLIYPELFAIKREQIRQVIIKAKVLLSL